MMTVRELIAALQELPEEAMDSDVAAPGCCGNCYVDLGLPVFRCDNVYLEGSKGQLAAPRPKLYQPSEEELELRAKGLLPE